MNIFEDPKMEDSWFEIRDSVAGYNPNHESDWLSKHPFGIAVKLQEIHS